MPIRIIKEYDLVELSLVDNPANQFANILSIEKVDGVDVVKGDGVNTVLENVFYDSESGLVMLSENESEISPVSGKTMENIGFVEKTDTEKNEMIKFLVDSAKGINLSKMTKEASPMNETTETVIKSDDVVEEAQVAPEADTAIDVDVTKSDEADAEKAAGAAGGSGASTDNVDDEDDDMDDEDDATKGNYKEKADDAASQDPAVEKSEESEVSKSDDVVNAVADIKNTLTSAFSDLAATVKSLHEQVAELNKSLSNANSELASVKSELSAAKSEFDNFGKRVDAVEADTAFRKSGDLGEIVQEVQMNKSEQSLWGGRFLKTADLFR